MNFWMVLIILGLFVVLAIFALLISPPEAMVRRWTGGKRER